MVRNFLECSPLTPALISHTYTAHILHTYRTHTAHILHTYRTHTAHILHTYCTYTAKIPQFIAKGLDNE